MKTKKKPIDDWAIITKEVHDVFENCGYEKGWLADKDGEKELWFLFVVGKTQLAFRGTSTAWKATSLIHQVKIGKVDAKPSETRWLNIYVDGPFYEHDVRNITAHFTSMAEDFARSLNSQEGTN